MHTREDFIKRIMNGGEVTMNDLDNSRYMAELNEIREEAAERLEVQRIEHKRAEQRKLQIKELLRLDAEVERISYDDELNEQRRNEVLRPIAVRELKLREEWHSKRSQFHQLFAQVSGDHYNFRVVNNPLIAELRKSGAVLDKVNVSILEIPVSPAANMLLEERRRERSES